MLLRRLSCLILIGVSLLLISADGALCQAPPASPMPASITVTVRSTGDLLIAFSAYGLPLRFHPPTDSTLQQQLESAFGIHLKPVRSLSGPETDWDDEDESAGATPPLKQRKAPTTSYWYFSTQSAAPVGRNGLVRTGAVDLTPLLPALNQAGIQRLSVRFMLPNRGYETCSLPRVTRQAPPGMRPGLYVPTARSARFLPVVFAGTVSTGNVGLPIRYEFGYRAKDVLRIVLPLAVLAVLPMLLTLWTRRNALCAKDVDPAAVWFGYWRWQNWSVSGFWFLWITAFPFVGGIPFLVDALNLPSGVIQQIAILIVMLAPAGAIAVICTGLSLPVYEKVRGIKRTRAYLMKKAGWQYAAQVIPINCTMLGFLSIGSPSVLAAMWMTIGFLASWFCFRQLQKLNGMGPHALMHGELRDHVGALAQKAGVDIRFVYIIPDDESANAFAAKGNLVALTNYLLQRLNRREVDAVVAHELTHLRKKHPIVIQVLTWVMIIASVILANVVRQSAGAALVHIPLYPVIVWLIGLPCLMVLSRRFEFMADAGAVEITGDPEGAISGLIALTRLNFMPIQIRSSQQSTHPSTLRRVQALANRYGVPQNRLDALIAGERVADYGTAASAVSTAPPDFDLEFAEPHAPSEAAAAQGGYALPPEAFTADRIFSSDYRRGRNLRGLFAYLAAMIVPLLAAAHWIRTMPDGASALKCVIGVLSLVAACALYTYVTWLSSCWDLPYLRPRLREKLLAGAPNPEEYTLIGLSPGGLPMSYEGRPDWDKGFLRLDGDLLHYVGEQARFTLRRDQIGQIVRIVAPSNWWTFPRIVIAWVDAENGVNGAFNLRPQDVTRAGQMQAHIEEFLARLQAWHRAANAAAAHEYLGLPPIGQGAGLSYRTLGTFRALGNVVQMCAFIAAIAGWWTALGVRDLEWWYLVLGTAFVAVFSWWPEHRYVEPAIPQPPPAPARAAAFSREP